MKKIAIFCDGTWNSADQANEGQPCPTNVVKLALRLARRKGDISQVAYYGQGVGTGNLLDRFTGGAFGHGLDDNLYAAYRFLMLNYEVGDDIYLFGFSRGAYTARSLAGMVRKCGILRLRSARQYHEAVKLYCNEQHPDEEGPTGFRCSHGITESEQVPIKFIGVWDTVGSLGIPARGLRALTEKKYRFHDVQLSGTVQNAFQALAIDERRAPFEAARWAYKPKEGQRIEQVWFCGAHSDIGGGYPAGEWGLSDITLQWMMAKAAECELGFDPDSEAAYAFAPNALSKVHDSKVGMYRLTPGIDRVIGMAAKDTQQPTDYERFERDPTQSLHPTVLQRWKADPTYRPENLKRYFAKFGDDHAAI